MIPKDSKTWWDIDARIDANLRQKAPKKKAQLESQPERQEPQVRLPPTVKKQVPETPLKVYPEPYA